MNNLFLIGFMGCGKSTVAKALSEMYGMTVIEMDQEIETAEGMAISEIFASKGEAYFREKESELIRRIETTDNQVVSCGGGVVLRCENVERMKASGKVVYLTAKAETILKRVAGDSTRPLLKNKKDVILIQEMMNARLGKYEAAADYNISTDDKDVKEICSEIYEKIIRK